MEGRSKIIHVPRRFTRREWGGTEVVITALCREQRRAGFTPEIATSQALDGTEEEWLEEVCVRRFRHYYPYLGLSASQRLQMDKKGGNLVSPALLRYLLSTADVRIFHAHAGKRMGGTVRTAARLRKLPFVVTLHGGAYDIPQDELASMLRPAAGTWEWGRALGALLGSRRVLLDADHVICVGLPEYEKARRELPHDRVSYVPNGVDTGAFARGQSPEDAGRHAALFRSRYGIDAEAPILLCLGRIDRQKNQLLLVEAYARLAPRHPDTRLVLIGPHTQPDYAAHISQRVAEYGLGARTVIIPGLAHGSDELRGAIHACDAMVLPSIHEPFGIVVLEAWSAGKPVVASRVGGLSHLIEDGQSGLLFDPLAADAAEALAAHVTRILTDPAMAAELGHSGRREAEKYSWITLAAQLESIYQRAEEHAARQYHNRRQDHGTTAEPEPSHGDR